MVSEIFYRDVGTIDFHKTGWVGSWTQGQGGRLQEKSCFWEKSDEMAEGCDGNGQLKPAIGGGRIFSDCFD
jgi:hypothetical protein